MNPKKTFGEHLSEIRERLLFSFGIFLLGSFIGYIFYNQILNFLITPLHSPLYYSSPAGGFDFAIKICIFFGIAFSLPVFTYNFLRFIEPTILRKPRFFVLRFLIASLLLMTLGISFAYYVGLPAALHFLGKFGSGDIKSLILTPNFGFEPNPRVLQTRASTRLASSAEQVKRFALSHSTWKVDRLLLPHTYI